LDYQFALLSWTLFFTAGIGLFVALVAWRRRYALTAQCLILMEAGVVVWAVTAAFEAAAGTIPLKLLWSQISYLGITGAIVSYFFLGIAYGQHSKYLTPRYISLILIIPLFTILAVATNSWHHSFYTEISIKPENNIAIYEHGLLFWIHIIYSYSLLVIGLVIIFRAILRFPAIYKSQSIVLMIGAIFPFTGNVMYVFNLNPIPGVDWTPIAFGLSGLILTWGIFRYRLLDLIPIARHKLVETMNVGVLVIDSQGRIADFNPAMQTITGITTKQALGQVATQALADWEELIDCLKNNTECQLEIGSANKDTGVYYNLQMSMIYNRQRQLSGKLIMLRDITNRIQFQVDLKERENKYRLLVENTETGFVAVDDTGVVIEANEPYIRMAGYENTEDVVGRSVIEWTAPESKEENAAAVALCAKQGYIQDFETIYLRGDGTRINILINATMQETLSGKRLNAFCRDITERKLAEKKVKDSERRFEDIALSSADWIWEVDKNGKYVFASGKIKQILGYEPEEIIGKTPFDLMPEAEAKRIGNIFNEIAANKEPIIDLENWNITKTGKKICLLTNGVPIIDEKNDLLGYRGVDKDITAQKTAEEVARKAQLVRRVLYQIAYATSTERSLTDLFKAIHNHLTAVIDTTNFYIAFYNTEEDSVTFPYFVDEMDEPPTTALPIGKGLTAYLLHEGKSLYLTKDKIKKLAQAGAIEIVGTLPERWLGVPLNVKNQNVGAVVVQSYKDPNLYSKKDLEILEFVSDQIANAIVHKQAEEAVRQSEEKYRILSEHLNEANSMKELLLDVITHDLKNPAGVISGMAEIVVDENPEDEMLQLIKDSSDSLLKVIDNANVLAKVTLEEGISKEELDLVKMIKNIQTEFESSLENASMNLECELPDKLIIKANPILTEVFKNYISNAIKYAHDGEKIIIDGKKEVNRVIVNVMDFGQSIPAEEYDNIFKRNIQLSKEKGRGRGLGLAIVKRIAEAHNAKVGVKPNEPTGNIFYIKIPTN